MQDPLVRGARQQDQQGVVDLYRHLHPEGVPLMSEAAAPAWAALLGSGLTHVLCPEGAGPMA